MWNLEWKKKERPITSFSFDIVDSMVIIYGYLLS